MMRRRPPPVVLSAAIALAGALGIAGLSLWQALEIERPPAPRAETPPIQLAALVARTAFPAAAVSAALDRDPFRPERNRPPVRFRSPAERLAAAAPAETGPVLVAAVRPELPRLVGTMVLPGGEAVALCELRGQSPRLLRAGDRIGEYVLERVGRRQATFRSPQTGTVELHVPTPGS